MKIKEIIKQRKNKEEEKINLPITKLGGGIFVKFTDENKLEVHTEYYKRYDVCHCTLDIYQLKKMKEFLNEYL